MEQYIQFLRESAVDKAVIDTFLDPAKPSWAQFDPELGYVLGNDISWGGIDGSRPIFSVAANGARKSAMYPGVTCRINTYGDSFTGCDQVNDHETWQEYLGAHFGEPVRNFGMGGYGFYQAYRRMVRTEVTADGAEYVLLYIWGNDHMRSLLRCRYALIRPWWDSRGGRMFHNNFWAHIEMDLDTGRLVEKPNLLPTPESLYQMTDPDFLVEALRDDWMLQIAVHSEGWIDEIEREPVNRLAEILGTEPLPQGKGQETRSAAVRIRDCYGFAATRQILVQAEEFTREHGKKLVIVLFDPKVTRELIAQESRYDQEVVDFLENRRFKYFDMNRVHAADFKSFRLTLEEYMKRYFIGHYSPAGNHFFAFAIKNSLLEWLDPKPVTYREDSAR